MSTSQFDARRHLSAAEALSGLPGPEGARFRGVFRHGSLEAEVYAPVEVDEQTPHTRDEVYVVISGSGTFVCEAERASFGAGDLLFAPAGAVHRFEDFTHDLAVWVFFYGPEGGEASR